MYGNYPNFKEEQREKFLITFRRDFYSKTCSRREEGNFSKKQNYFSAVNFLFICEIS